MTNQISHPDLVRKLFKDPRTINLSPEQVNLLHAAVGLAGEAGEVLEYLMDQTEDRMTAPDRQHKLLNELGDVSFYLEAFCQGFGYKLTAPKDYHTGHMPHKERIKRATWLNIATTQLLDIVKKQVFNNREGLREMAIGALIDIAAEHRHLCNSISFTSNDAREANIAKLSTRYQGLEYSDEAAAARRDEQ